MAGMTAARRIALVLVVVGVGSALWTSSSAAIIDGDGSLRANIYNLTPYTWTLVASGAPTASPFSPEGCSGVACVAWPCKDQHMSTCWATLPAAKIKPGESSGIYKLVPNSHEYDNCCTLWGYDGYFTYKVEVLGGPPEYVTVAITGAQSNGDYGDHIVHYQAWDTVAPPPSNYDPGTDTGTAPPVAHGCPGGDAPPNPPAVGATSKPQLACVYGNPQPNDLTFQIKGNYTVDASTDLGGAFINVLNEMCGGGPNTSCSFTQTKPLTFGIGPPGSPRQATNCSAPGAEPNYFKVEYEATQSASLSIGGSVTATAEVNLFNSIASEASISVEAEHEWEETKEFTRENKLFIPVGDIASLWEVPVVGKVTGTLVVSNGSATFTATNFSEERSPVSRDPLTPAFNAITKARPMTPAERLDHCHEDVRRALGAPSGKAPAKLVPGVGVARGKLGQTQADVARLLGQPRARRFLMDPCRGLDPRCYAASETGGTWSYRQLSVVFGPDLRVSALIYSGPQHGRQHVGVGSTLAAVRTAFPRVGCSKQAGRIDCAQTRVNGSWAVKTVFRLTKGRGDRFKCTQVLIYVVHDGPRQVSG